LPPRHQSLPKIQAQYGQALRALGILEDDRPLRQRGLTVQRRSLENVPEDSPDWAQQALLLGEDFVDEAWAAATPEEMNEAFDLFMRAARQPSGAASVRWQAALDAVELRVAQQDWSSALQACTAAIDVLPRLAWGGLGLDDKLRALGDTSQTVSLLASVALNAGAPERALEILEHGRGLLLSQALDRRADLDAVRRHAPELAARLAQLSEEPAHGGDTAAAGVRRRRLQYRWEETVEEVRRLPGLADFLKPLPYRELVAVAEHGPVVVLTSSPLRSDALVLYEGSLSVVPLPLFRHTRAVRRAGHLSLLQQASRRDETSGAADGGLDDLRDYLTDLLGWLWAAVAEPVLAALPDRCRAVPDPARIWWCPTGVFNHLPVHAASRLDLRDPDHVIQESLADTFVSSYTPTLRALRTARRAEAAQPSTAASPVLLVGVGRTPPGSQLPPIADATEEIEEVARLFPADPRPLCDEEATRDLVLQRIRAGGWFHFAGHGDQGAEEPDGRLYLWDCRSSGPLLMRDIAGLRLQRAELAYLSACRTHVTPRAHSDEPVSLAGSLQLAGYRHVVATQWEVQSYRARKVAARFYRELLEGDVGSGATAPAAARAAHALHVAVGEQRRRFPERVEVWASYIHLGA